MTRETLERRQVWIYLLALLLGLAAGSLWPGAGESLDALVWPALALLLYATFTQVRIRAVPQAFKDARLLLTALIGNFAVMPVVVWGLVQFAPEDQALRLGLLLVLLVPCTDWFITFTQLGKGDATGATVLAPTLLIVQFLLLPLYLWLMAGEELTSVFTPADIWPALVVVLLPLGLAALSELLLSRGPGYRQFTSAVSWWPVPLLALVVFLVAVSHAGQAYETLHLLPVVIAVAASFLVLSLIIARALAAVARLPMEQGRTLAFTLGTRNSFIVLPFALSLPAGWEIAAIVIVMQSMVELLGMICYLWFVPRVLFPEPRAAQ
ncbi:arsenic resistance protein [Nesterenkonia muleiensis]|uniref:arsenic resistance protein n=1 Tax=Nesterenkonia muleiensis TaxID=2282648 RepID=UPI000E710528|nr:arsenic resistance protein [Nesterenkonia muleiensis]